MSNRRRRMPTDLTPLTPLSHTHTYNRHRRRGGGEGTSPCTSSLSPQHNLGLPPMLDSRMSYPNKDITSPPSVELAFEAEPVEGPMGSG